MWVPKSQSMNQEPFRDFLTRDFMVITKPQIRVILIYFNAGNGLLGIAIKGRVRKMLRRNSWISLSKY